MNPTTLISGVGYLILAIIVIRQIKYCRGQAEPFAWAVLSALGVGYVVYYTYASLTGTLDPQLFNILSSSLRLTTIITVITIELARLRRMGIKRGC